MYCLRHCRHMTICLFIQKFIVYLLCISQSAKHWRFWEDPDLITALPLPPPAQL